jgi:hypothetical protein
MIVNRRTYIARPGHADKLAEVFKKGKVFFPFHRPNRLYVSELTTFGQVAVEVEFKDLAEYERFWKEAMEKATESWWKEFFDVVTTGGTNEIWRLVE